MARLPIASFASEATLARMIGFPSGPVNAPTGGARLLARPVVEKVSDPSSDLDDILEIIEGDRPARRPPNPWLTRQRGPRVDVVHGQGRVDGRACCWETLEDVNRRLPVLRLPYTESCKGCGAVYRVAQQLTIRPSR